MYCASFVTKITWSNIWLFLYSTLEWAMILTVFRKLETYLLTVFDKIFGEWGYFSSFLGVTYNSSLETPKKDSNFFSEKIGKSEYETWCTIKWLRRWWKNSWAWTNFFHFVQKTITVSMVIWIFKWRVLKRQIQWCTPEIFEGRSGPQTGTFFVKNSQNTTKKALFILFNK